MHWQLLTLVLLVVEVESRDEEFRQDVGSDKKEEILFLTSEEVVATVEIILGEYGGERGSLAFDVDGDGENFPFSASANR